MSYFEFLDGLYPEWHAKALCNGDDPAIWFPSASGLGNANTREVVIRDALAICANCPVLSECNADAEAHGERWGIWAGLDREAKTEADDAA